MDVIDGKEPVTEPATQSSLAASDAVRIGELTERGGLTIELAIGILLDQDLSDPSLLVSTSMNDKWTHGPVRVSARH